jgi:rhamnosyltransferase
MLDAVLAQDVDARVEVIVVDSGSTDGTVEAARRGPVRLVQIPNAEFGHGRTRNLLAQFASGPLLAFLTADAVPADATWLRRLVAPFSDRNVAACFGRQLAPPGADPVQVHHLLYWYPPEPAIRALDGASDAHTRRLFYSHVNAAFRKAVWRQIRFDESVLMSEDQEWSRRVLLAGHRIVYVPEAAVVHWHENALRADFGRHFHSGAALQRITVDSSADWLGQGFDYMRSKLGYLVASGAWDRIPYALLYEAMRFLAFFLGRNGRFIPRRFWPRLGQHRQFRPQPLAAPPR